MVFLDIARYTLYVLDFIFGVLAWGITTDRLKTDGFCELADSFADGRQTKACNVVIAFGVISMILLLVVVLLRTVALIGAAKFPEIIEFFMFLLMTIIWLILAIIMVSVTSSFFRGFDRVRGAIAGAWIAFFTHAGSTVIPLLARRQEEVEETKD